MRLSILLTFSDIINPLGVIGPVPKASPFPSSWNFFLCSQSGCGEPLLYHVALKGPGDCSGDNWNLSEGCCKARSLQLSTARLSCSLSREGWRHRSSSPVKKIKTGNEREPGLGKTIKKLLSVFIKEAIFPLWGKPRRLPFFKKIIEFPFPGYSYSIELLYWQPKVTTHFSTPGEKEPRRFNRRFNRANTCVHGSPQMPFSQWEAMMDGGVARTSLLS